jgi:anti-anti-sigma regulatory factor
MTWKIEKVVTGKTCTLHLSGRIRTDHLEDLKLAMGDDLANCALDLGEVTIVDVDVVRFLGQLEKAGVTLLHCSRYIRKWINKEGEAYVIKVKRE